MKATAAFLRLAATLLATIPFTAPAATLYVDVNSTNPVAPYSTWATASPDIQDAVNAANPGDTVLVTNGIYQTGGEVVAPYSLTNRVAVTVPITVESVNGPAVTVIMGSQAPVGIFGDSLIRCVYLTNGASLIGFTLTNGATRDAGDAAHEESGGGLCCESTNAFVSNCVISGNTAHLDGAGAYAGTLNNCTLQNNFGNNGGGAYGSTLNNCFVFSNSVSGSGGGGGGVSDCRANNCTIVANAAINGTPGGGALSSTLYNCIVYFNSGSTSNYTSSSTFNYCCTAPLPSGPGNIAGNPGFIAYPQIASNSPCIGAGSQEYSSGMDIYGDPWLNPPSIGCVEPGSGNDTGPLSVAITASTPEVFTNSPIMFTANANGFVTGVLWDFGDGTRVTNLAPVSHAWSTPGSYSVTLTAFNDSYPSGVSATYVVSVVLVTTHYVSLSSTAPVSPFESWATAATNIQQAVNAAKAGELVLVTNGVYQTGGAAAPPDNLMTRVSVNAAIAIASVNGPSQTVIQGYQDPVTTNGSDAIRCVYLAKGASLTGFTVTGGATAIGTNTYSGPPDFSCGGVYCASSNVYVTNCVISNNASGLTAAGVLSGTLYNCTVVDNTNLGLTGNPESGGGGAYYSTLVNCSISGNNNGQAALAVLYECTLVNCLISSNIANYAATVSGSTLTDCTLTGNTGGISGGASGCVLNNCVLAGNVASDNSGPSGGGAYGCTLANCTLFGNSSWYDGGGGASESTLVNCSVISNSVLEKYPASGGGVYGSTLDGCLIAGNTTPGTGGGAYNCLLNNCTVVSNSSAFCGGAAGGTNNNCIVMFNVATNTPASNNFSFSTLNYCDTTPLPPRGVGNITSNPDLSDAYHIASFSPCRGAGSSAYTNGMDLDGEPWLNPPSIGCDEYYGSGPLIVSIGAPFTNAAPECPLAFSADISGSVGSILWNFGDGTAATNILSPTHSWSLPGNYIVTLTAYNASNPAGVSASIPVSIILNPIRYVNQGSTNPVSPFLSWDTAATNIQDAVDAVPAIAGVRVLVSNGVYNVVGRVAPLGAYVSNCLVVTNSAIIQSVNGPTVTAIEGQFGSLFVSPGVRCVWLGDNASFSGFTVFNGMASSEDLGYDPVDNYGGAIWCSSSSSVVFNCIIISNTAAAAGSAYGGTLYDCLLIGNNVGEYGGGAYQSVLINCTVSSNYAYGAGSGTYDCTNFSSIIFSNNNTADDSGSMFYYCCTPVSQAGPGNITNNPLFVNAANGNYRLQSNSPCINAGNNAYVTTAIDLDGNPRISGGTVDIGAYEFQNPASIISYAWLEQYGLPTDGTADFADTDGNGMNNWQKWVAGLNPTNPASILQMMPPATSGSNIVVTWQSVTNINYFLERSLGINPPSFQTIATNIPGQTGTTSYTDTNAPAPGPWFYQVGVP